MCTQSLSSGGRGFHARHNSAVLTTLLQTTSGRWVGRETSEGRSRSCAPGERCRPAQRGTGLCSGRPVLHLPRLDHSSPPVMVNLANTPPSHTRCPQYPSRKRTYPLSPAPNSAAPRGGSSNSTLFIQATQTFQRPHHGLGAQSPGHPASLPPCWPKDRHYRAPHRPAALHTAAGALAGRPASSPPAAGRLRQTSTTDETHASAPPTGRRQWDPGQGACPFPPFPWLSKAVAASPTPPGEDAREAGRAPPAPEPRRVRDPLPRGRPLGARDPDHSQRPFSEEARWGRPPAQPRKDPSLAPARPAPAQPGAARRPPGHPGRSPHRLSPPGAAATAAAAAAQISLFYARAHVSRDVRLRSRETWAGPAVSSGSARLQVPGTPRPSPELPTPGRGRKEGTRNQSRPARGTLVVPPPPACRLPLGGCLAPYCVE